MLLYHIYYLEIACYGVLVLTGVAMACAAYAYYVNSKRPDDDPQKKDYELVALFFVPFTWLFILIGSILIALLFVIRALLYGIFITLFTFALIFIRKSFVLAWLRKTATSIGDRLMEVNTLIVRLFLQPWANGSGRT